MHDFAHRGPQPRSKVSPLSTYQKSQQDQLLFRLLRKLGLAAIVLGISLSLSLVIVVVAIFQLATWKANLPIGLALLTGEKNQIRRDTTLLWVDPTDQKITLLTLPSSELIRTPSSGQYSLSSLYGLYALDHQPIKKYLQTLVRNIRIDTTGIVVADTATPTTDTASRILRQSMLDPSVISSLSFPDRFSLWWYLRFHSGEIEKLDMPANLASRTDAFDDVTYDKFVQKNFVNSAVKKEAVTVAIINASGQARLASTVGRLFSALGLNIISVGDTPSIMQHGRIVIASSRGETSPTLDILRRYIDARLDVDNNTAAEYRADIVVFLSTQEAADFTP